MGKIGGSSWFNAVKKAFRSPTKDNSKRSSRSREEHEQQDEEKERGKRRWIFRKPCVHETTIQHNEAKNITTTATTNSVSAGTSATNPEVEATDVSQRRAIAVAMATTAAAEAAVATAQAAVEIIRLTRPSIFVREHYAAIAIQTAFRGYLARKALKALKGLVKLQALVRGHNVRKRAKMTLRCMQALIRVQARVRDQRKRLSYEGSTDSVLSEQNNLWESYLANRKSISRDGSSITNEWDSHPHTVEEIKAMSQITMEPPLKRENTLAHAFYHQMWRSGNDQFPGNNEEQEGKSTWFNQATPKQLERMGRASCDQRDPLKTVEMDTAQPYSYSAPNFQTSQNPYYHYQQKLHSHSIPSPLHRTHQNLLIHSPSTPTPIKIKPLRVHSASPRCLREERNLSMAQTPTLGSTYYHRVSASGNSGSAPVPNYMASTASTKARVRSQSAPRQRPLTPEREKVVSSKKRLSFPVPDPSYNGGIISDVDLDQNLRSPSCKNIHGGRFEVEQSSNMSSCFKDRVGDDISPPPTSDVRRWFR